MASTPVDDLALVLDVNEPLVAAVRDAQWSVPTPCTEWNVRELLAHVVGGNVMYARIARGDASSFEEARPAGDPLGDDPPAAHRAAAGELVAAFRTPGALERVFPLPIGSAPGIVAVHLRLVELLTHGWDLAHATGQRVDYPEEVVERELAFTRERLGDIPSTRTPFGPPRPVPGDAPAIERLVACLGRSVEPA